MHVLVTSQFGGNSREYTFNFIGLERFEGIDQRLIYTSSFTDTDDERRRAFARTLELGMVRYVLETPQAEGLIVQFTNGEEEGEEHRGHLHPEPNNLVADAEDDPWNYWVYRIRMENDFSTEDRRDSQTYRASASAGRTTDMWRMGMGAFVALGMERPWGEAHVDLQYSHFIDDIDRSRIEFNTDIEYRIVRGLSFDIYAGVSRIRDQIYLPKGGATDEEVLVARRQLETDLSFRGGIELRYPFGSIYNNVVNSRLSSESGGFSRIF